MGDINDQSCGWPKGTVRAIVALTSIPLAFVGSIAIMIILIIQKEYTIALGVNSVIWGVIGTIIGHYFGAKQAEGAANLIYQAEHDVLENRNAEIRRQIFDREVEQNLAFMERNPDRNYQGNN